MHQSGQERAHSMQTVQFSSLSAITPRARVGGSSRSCGYCTVTAGLSIVLSVTPNPVTRPGSFGFMSVLLARTSEGHLEDAGEEDVGEAERNEELPGERLELVFTKTRVGEPDPEHQERHEHDLAEEHEGPDEPHHAVGDSP